MALTTESAARKDRTTGASATMEHRHMAFIAATLKETMPPAGMYQDHEAIRETWEDIVKHFASQLRASNPRFDRDRFLKACGYID